METPKEYEFDEENFKVEFAKLFKDWENNWAQPIGLVQRSPGPKGMITPRMLKNMSKEAIEAEKPEQEAFKKLVEYCATTIALNERHEGIKKVLNAVVTKFKLSNPTRTAQTILADFLVEIFDATMELIKKQGTIDEIIKLQRDKLGGVFNFGVKKAD